MGVNMEHSSQDIYEMHAIVKGTVQGIGFRALTRYYAAAWGSREQCAICRTGLWRYMRMDQKSVWKS